jgi:putative two-component system response regulator
VVFLTADSDRETEIMIFRAGAMDYIQKPFIAEVVIRRISRILELYHLQQSLQDEVEKKTEELQESHRKMTNLSVQVMLTLANTIDAKDEYTRGHSVRVANYSREIARRMGMGKQEMAMVYYTGLLHDIGKIGIPDAIINKPDKLTQEEYAIIKNHPVIGAEILKDMTEIPNASIGAHWHHERYDGRGYPDGLKGEEIPEPARIIGVADAYDTMSSKRKYRDVLPQKMIRVEIERGKGTQFDPQITDIMLAMIDEDVNYDMREK